MLARRTTRRDALMLLPVRLFLAAGWLRAGAEKLTAGYWWHGDQVRDYVATEHDDALPFLRPAMRSLHDHGGAAVAAFVVILEVACGFALLLGVRLRTALWAGIVMNVVFVATGRVNPSAFYLVLEMVLLFAIAQGVIGAARPSRRVHPMVAAAGWASAATALAPFVRTMEPAHAIEDPALMLLFLALLLSVGHLLLWLLADERTRRFDGTRWATRIARWSRGG